MSTATMVRSASSIVVPQSYPATINSRYTVNRSNFIDIVQRYNDTVASMTSQAQRNWHANLAIALRAFRKNHPNLKNFLNRKTFRLCLAQEITIGQIVIDTTMQREPDMSWILKIITNFRAYQAQPIQVYKNSDGKWGAWDGQHTALALYLIATDMGLDINDTTIPGCIYDIVNRGELRGNFINNNTTVGKNAGKKPLELIDVIQQMIYGVLVDGVIDPEWVDIADKHLLLASAGMFLTAEKFGDANQPGAITRMDELKDASLEVVRQFCVYGKFIVDSQQRAIDTKELPIIIEFLNMCERDQIVYTDAELVDMAQHLDRWFGANFDAKGPYWGKVYQANINAYNKAHKGLPKHLWPDAPKNLKNVPIGTTYFWHLLRNSWAGPKGTKFKFPKSSFNSFVPAVGDLW